MTRHPAVTAAAEAWHARQAAARYARSADEAARLGFDLTAASDRIRAAEWIATAVALETEHGLPPNTDPLDLCPPVIVGYATLGSIR